MNTIDIILCVYNSSDTISECIDSLLNQTYGFFNLYIFDDCSTDDTVDKIKKYSDKRITLVCSGKNIGTYAAKNFILKNFCNSEYVALHDADDYSEPTRLEKQIETMTSHKIHCLGTAVREFWEDQRPHTISDQITKNKERLNVYPLDLDRTSLVDLIDNSKLKYDEFLKFKICMNGSVMFTRKILEDLGGWDGKTRVGGDTDIFIRLMSKYKIYNLDECLYNRRFHEKSLTASNITGINSDIRKSYNCKRVETIKNSIQRKMVIKNFYYPEFDYEVVRCVE